MQTEFPLELGPEYLDYYQFLKNSFVNIVFAYHFLNSSEKFKPFKSIHGRQQPNFAPIRKSTNISPGG